MYTGHSIIIEGPDGSGKSHLVNELAATLALLPNHSQGYPGSHSNMINRCAIGHIGYLKGNFLFDRHVCISEQVYGKAMRGESLVDPEFADMALSAINPIIIYLTPDSDLLDQRKNELVTKEWKDQEHIDTVMKNYQGIIREYDMVMSRLGSKFIVMHVDPMDEGEREVIRQLVTGVMVCAG